MDRIFAWIVDRLRWLLLGATGLGLVLAYMGWSDASRIRDIAANGVEATARVEGATVVEGRRRGKTYSLKLSWQDAKGGARTADRVTVSSTYARKHIRGDTITLDTVRIKYLPDNAETMPIVLDDVGRQEDSDEFMLTLGIGLAGGGAVGSLLMFLFTRRRRD
jgi:hypothetical protein